jgi:hypothetical protein
MFTIPGGPDTGPSRGGPFFNNFIKTEGGSTAGKISSPDSGAGNGTDQTRS